MDDSRHETPLEEELAERRTSFVAALSGGDARSACAAYADDATLIPPAADRLEGRAAIERFWTAGVDAGITGLELEALAFANPVGIAYELGRYTIRLDPPNGCPVLDRGTYLLVHQRGTAGAWQRAVEMFSPDTHGQTANPRTSARSPRRS